MRIGCHSQAWRIVVGLFCVCCLGCGQCSKTPTGAWRAGHFFTEPDVVALAKAAQNGDLEEIDQLVAAGVDINAKGLDDITPLIWAMLIKNKPAFKRLLEQGADPDSQIDDGRSAISYAARWEGDSEWLEMLLDHGADPNITRIEFDRYTRVPLFDAILSRDINNLELLIQADADIDFEDEVSGLTPLMDAANDNWFEGVHRLLEAGADYRVESGGFDLAYYTIESNIDPKFTETIRWREKVIEFLENEGFDLEPARKAVAERKKKMRDAR